MLYQNFKPLKIFCFFYAKMTPICLFFCCRLTEDHVGPIGVAAGRGARSGARLSRGVSMPLAVAGE
jgi:hypothetical protein